MEDMTDIIQAMRGHREVDQGDFVGIQLYLYDASTGREIPGHEVLERFKNLTITGVFVKPRDPREGGACGPITDITEDTVVVQHINGSHKTFPKEIFHDLHVID